MKDLLLVYLDKGSMSQQVFKWMQYHDLLGHKRGRYSTLHRETDHLRDHFLSIQNMPFI